MDTSVKEDVKSKNILIQNVNLEHYGKTKSKYNRNR